MLLFFACSASLRDRYKRANKLLLLFVNNEDTLLVQSSVAKSCILELYRE